MLFNGQSTAAYLVTAFQILMFLKCRWTFFFFQCINLVISNEASFSLFSSFWLFQCFVSHLICKSFRHIFKMCYFIIAKLSMSHFPLHLFFSQFVRSADTAAAFISRNINVTIYLKKKILKCRYFEVLGLYVIGIDMYSNKQVFRTST